MKNILTDKKGQVSLEALLIISVVILAALLTGYYLKQLAQNNTNKIKDYQSESVKGTQ